MTQLETTNQISSKLFNTKSGNTIIVALDCSSISGPEDGLRDLKLSIEKARRSGASGILGLPGMFRAYREEIGDMAFISNITLSTEGPHHLDKVKVGSASHAAKIGMDAVSVHVNMTAPTESGMLQTLAETGQECEELGMELLAHMYPRRIVDGGEDRYQELKEKDPEGYAKLVRHGARVAVDLGATVVKVPWTGTKESFRTVCESTYGLPVVMAGGSKVSIPEFLQVARDAMDAGARGVAVGSNFYMRPNDGEDEFFLRALCNVVHDGMNVSDAMAKAKA